MAIILAAAEMAKANRDQAALDEVLRVGLTLLAKWPAFLLSRVDGHPDFDWRSDSDGTTDEAPPSSFPTL